MKKPILVLFILTCNLSFGQTKDLQQSIDSFRTALSQQNIQIKNLQAQVYQLNAVLNAMRSSLNDVQYIAKTDSATYKPKTVLKKTVVKTNQTAANVTVVDRSNTLPPYSRYYRTIKGKKYYIDLHNKQKFTLLPSGRKVYVHI